MSIYLMDDGTMDTVLRCSECGEEFRYNYDPSDADAVDANVQEAYEEFIDWAITDAAADHACTEDAHHE